MINQRGCLIGGVLRLSDVNALSLSQPVDFETKRTYTLKVEGSNPHIDAQFIAWGPYKDEATIKVFMHNMFVK